MRKDTNPMMCSIFFLMFFLFCTHPLESQEVKYSDKYFEGELISNYTLFLERGELEIVITEKWVPIFSKMVGCGELFTNNEITEIKYGSWDADVLEPVLNLIESQSFGILGEYPGLHTHEEELNQPETPYRRQKILDQFSENYGFRQNGTREFNEFEIVPERKINEFLELDIKEYKNPDPPPNIGYDWIYYIIKYPSDVYLFEYPTSEKIRISFIDFFKGKEIDRDPDKRYFFDVYQYQRNYKINYNPLAVGGFKFRNKEDKSGFINLIFKSHESTSDGQRKGLSNQDFIKFFNSPRMIPLKSFWNWDDSKKRWFTNNDLNNWIYGNDVDIGLLNESVPGEKNQINLLLQQAAPDIIQISHPSDKHLPENIKAYYQMTYYGNLFYDVNPFCICCLEEAIVEFIPEEESKENEEDEKPEDFEIIIPERVDPEEPNEEQDKEESEDYEIIIPEQLIWDFDLEGWRPSDDDRCKKGVGKVNNEPGEKKVSPQKTDKKRKGNVKIPYNLTPLQNSSTGKPSGHIVDWTFEIKTENINFLPDELTFQIPATLLESGNPAFQDNVTKPQCAIAKIPKTGPTNSKGPAGTIKVTIPGQGICKGKQTDPPVQKGKSWSKVTGVPTQKEMDRIKSIPKNKRTPKDISKVIAFQENKIKERIYHTVEKLKSEGKLKPEPEGYATKPDILTWQWVRWEIEKMIEFPEMGSSSEVLVANDIDTTYISQVEDASGVEYTELPQEYQEVFNEDRTNLVTNIASIKAAMGLTKGENLGNTFLIDDDEPCGPTYETSWQVFEELVKWIEEVIKNNKVFETTNNQFKNINQKLGNDYLENRIIYLISKNIGGNKWKLNEDFIKTFLEEWKNNRNKSVQYQFYDDFEGKVCILTLNIRGVPLREEKNESAGIGCLQRNDLPNEFKKAMVDARYLSYIRKVYKEKGFFTLAEFEDFIKEFSFEENLWDPVQLYDSKSGEKKAEYHWIDESKIANRFQTIVRIDQVNKSSYNSELKRTNLTAEQMLELNCLRVMNLWDREQRNLNKPCFEFTKSAKPIKTSENYWEDQNNNGFPDPGEIIRYKYEIKNNGCDLKNVTLKDPKLGIEKNFGDLVRGESVRTENFPNVDNIARYEIKPDDILNHKVINLATVQAEILNNLSEEETQESKSTVSLHSDCECFNIFLEEGYLSKEKEREFILKAPKQWIFNDITITDLLFTYLEWTPLVKKNPRVLGADKPYEHNKSIDKEISIPIALRATAEYIGGFKDDCCTSFQDGHQDFQGGFVQIQFHLPLNRIESTQITREGKYPEFSIQQVPAPSWGNIPSRKPGHVWYSLSWTPKNYTEDMPKTGTAPGTADVTTLKAKKAKPVIVSFITDIGSDPILKPGNAKIELWVNGVKCNDQTIYLKLK